MSRNLLRLLDLHGDDHPLLFPSTSTCPFFASPSPSPSSSCPFFPPLSSFLLDHDALFFPSSCPDLDLFPLTFSPAVDLDPFLLHSLGNRVSALELALSPPAPAPRRKYTYAAEAAGRKVKWTAEEKPEGDRTLKWEAEIKTPHDDGFDRKWKWESKGSASGARKLKWTKAVKGKGWLEPWSHSYSVEEDFDCGGDDHCTEKDKKKAKEESNTKCAVEIVQIEDNTAGCVAIKKAFAMSHGKGKKKELSPQDAALLIQMNYRAHLAHRSQVLRCLRDLAVAKAKLKEIRSLFYNISYCRHIAHDSEECLRLAEKIIVLLLTVDALEGPDYMVRNAKRSMLEELEGMLEIVDPQPPGKPRTLNRREFDLPAGGVIPNEMTGAKNVIKIVEEGK